MKNLPFDTDDLDEVAKKYQDLYEKYEDDDGETRYKFVGVDGIKTQSDVDNAIKAKRQAVAKGKKARERLELFENLGLEPDELSELIDENESLKKSKTKKVRRQEVEDDDSDDDDTLGGVLPASERRRIKNQEKENAKLREEVERLKNRDKDAVKRDHIMKISKDLGFTDTGANHAYLLIKDIVDIVDPDTNEILSTEKARKAGFNEDETVKEILTAAVKDYPDWRGSSKGGGVKGGNSKSSEKPKVNPFGEKTWNVTQQQKLEDEFGEDYCDQLAQEANLADRFDTHG